MRLQHCRTCLFLHNCSGLCQVLTQEQNCWLLGMQMFSYIRQCQKVFQVAVSVYTPARVLLVPILSNTWYVPSFSFQRKMNLSQLKSSNHEKPHLELKGACTVHRVPGLPAVCRSWLGLQDYLLYGVSSPHVRCVCEKEGCAWVSGNQRATPGQRG